MVATAPCCCVTITIANWCASKAHRLAARSLVRLAQRLFEDFLGSDFFRIGDDAPSMAADTDEVVDASFGEPAPAATGTARRRGSGLASRISEQSEALLQEAAKHAAEFGRPEVDTEHLLLALTDSDVVKTILGQFKIKVDDLKRQIESEAKRGDKPFEGEIGVSPRVKDALSRAFVASNELSHSYVGPEHFLIGLAEEGEGLAANLLRRYGLTPQALRQQVSKVVGKGPRTAVPRRRPIRRNSKSIRATSPRWRARASSIRSSAARRRSRRPSKCWPGARRTTRC